MYSRSNLWLALVALFRLLNLAGTAYAAVLGEPIHAGIHALLVLASAYGVWRLAPRAVAHY